jgi:hypothetical protein
MSTDRRSSFNVLDSSTVYFPLPWRRLVIVLKEGGEIVASRAASERLRHGVR